MGRNVAGIGSVVVLYWHMTRYSMHVCRGILSIELGTVLIPCLVILHISNVYGILYQHQVPVMINLIHNVDCTSSTSINL